ncbi:lysine transporter LysE [Xylanibacillus composti]|uniref:L-lysine exporter family protein LysE/ArgO n=1 Tax=Xylanibacillus composti TaxID=1572762 RepID=A0A8J4M1P8_9BACL|nr:LysE family transporter [Xylanibacillus composti]MDT9724200.1 lysine transporter LysE [Xylanibacillus composti]GIQ68285.1 hypothetical protein XYCOK13_11090 [Xylanibacillus composti]
MLLVWFKGFLYSLSLCMDLGLVNVAILKLGLERGFRSSFALGLGSGIGDLIYLSLALAGLAVIFEYKAVSWGLWLLGTPVLLWLAWRMLRESMRSQAARTGQELASAVEQSVDKRSDWKLFAAGIGLALSSPSLILAFAATSGAIVASVNIRDTHIWLSFVTGFFTTGVLWSFVMAWISSRSGKLMGAKTVRVLSLISAGIFLYFAWHVFTHGLQTLL